MDIFGKGVKAWTRAQRSGVYRKVIYKGLPGFQEHADGTLGMARRGKDAPGNSIINERKDPVPEDDIDLGREDLSKEERPHNARQKSPPGRHLRL